MAPRVNVDEFVDVVVCADVADVIDVLLVAEGGLVAWMGLSGAAVVALADWVRSL